MIETLARQVGQLIAAYAGDSFDAHDTMAILKSVQEGLQEGPGHHLPIVDLPIITSDQLPKEFDVNAKNAVRLILGPGTVAVVPRAGFCGQVAFQFDERDTLTVMLEQDSRGGKAKFARYAMQPCAEQLPD